jgi:hypothetical protein
MCILKEHELFVYAWFDVGILFEHELAQGTALNCGARPRLVEKWVSRSCAAPFFRAVDL